MSRCDKVSCLNINKDKKGKKVSFCGNDILHELFSKREIVSKEKSIPPEFITTKKVPNNPYCSSITGQYMFDLSKISNFNIYFWKSSDDAKKNKAIKKFLKKNSTTALNWSSLYKKQTLSTFNQYTTFTSTTSAIVNLYEECDVVCVLVEKYDFRGSCYGPYYLYTDPDYVNNKVILFINNSYMNDENITEGGEMYRIFIHEFGHGFGLGHPHDNGGDSTIIPGITQFLPMYYPGIAGYIQNTIFDTVMSYNDVEFFLPPERDFSGSYWGYPESLMPLDALALRWMYNINEIPNEYITNYGVSVINPGYDQNNQSRMIVGNNQEITYGSNCYDVSFYFSKQNFTFNNLSYIRLEYNRVLETDYGFYPRDLESSISILNFDNEGISNVFIEKNALLVNLTINCLQNKILNVYIIEYKQRYSIKNNIYRNKYTKKVITIVNPANAVIHVFFNK